MAKLTQGEDIPVQKEGKATHIFQKSPEGYGPRLEKAIRLNGFFPGGRAILLNVALWEGGSHEEMTAYIVYCRDNAQEDPIVAYEAEEGWGEAREGSQRVLMTRPVHIDADAECCPSLELNWLVRWEGGAAREGEYSVRATKTISPREIGHERGITDKALISKLAGKYSFGCGTADRILVLNADGSFVFFRPSQQKPDRKGIWVLDPLWMDGGKLIEVGIYLYYDRSEKPLLGNYQNSSSCDVLTASSKDNFRDLSDYVEGDMEPCKIGTRL
jgi:hypothetical protein